MLLVFRFEPGITFADSEWYGTFINPQIKEIEMAKLTIATFLTLNGVNLSFTFKLFTALGCGLIAGVFSRFLPSWWRLWLNDHQQKVLLPCRLLILRWLIRGLWPFFWERLWLAFFWFFSHCSSGSNSMRSIYLLVVYSMLLVHSEWRSLSMCRWMMR